MRDYLITYNDDKVTTVRSIDAAHAKETLKQTVKVNKINNCKIKTK